MAPSQHPVNVVSKVSSSNTYICSSSADRHEGGLTYQMIEDLVPQNADHVKGLSGRHGIYEHVAMYANEMLGIQDTVLVLGIKALTTCLLVGFSVCSGPDWVVGGGSAMELPSMCIKGYIKCKITPHLPDLRCQRFQSQSPVL